MRTKVIYLFLPLFFFAAQTQAVTITFDYATPTDGSGKTSIYLNSNPSLSYFIETFDETGSSPYGAGLYNSDDTNIGSSVITVDSEGAFNTLNPNKLDVVGGFGITKGSKNYAATPAGDTTSFAYGPVASGQGYALPASVKIENEDFIGYQQGLYVRYLGLYYGSIDIYNNIAFYNGDSLLETSSGFLSDGILEGSEILSALNGFSGNQTGDGSNAYVNLFFDYDEVFTAFEFRTTGVAFELDNIVAGVGTAPVPEPATLILLGSGLAGLAFYRRKRK